MPSRPRFLRSRAAVFGLAVVGTVVVVALFAPLLAPHDFSDQQLPKVLLPPFWQPRADPAYPEAALNLRIAPDPDPFDPDAYFDWMFGGLK